MLNEREREIAESVRRGCLAAARRGYEQAGISGLCGEGRWEFALDAMSRQDLETLIALGTRNDAP